MSKQNIYKQSALAMGTSVHLEIVSAQPRSIVFSRMDQVWRIFRQVETSCSRFACDSELSLLSMQTGIWVNVSDTLFELIRFALQVAEMTDGNFDPTVGHAMASLGFKYHYLTRQPILDDGHELETAVSFRDVQLDERTRSVMLTKPIRLDLGAVAKGFAVDLATNELQSFEGFLIEAGGDVYAGGLNSNREPWLIGIQHPLHPESLMGSIRLSNAAVCTSGGYERKSTIVTNEHHLLIPQTGLSQKNVLSCSVIAPYAMLADAFSTAAYILGPQEGLKLLKSTELEGLWVLPSTELQRTDNFQLL
ncbi:FAD:protein FMN transferase [Paenibacillus sp. RC67]|uniref:FAD:protein FMN transferase n=1 Tax=Paenibacillus sp. RC67 TaxID=3039392 RepID=UPI0024ADADC4|nr:FAD:protein FMN transferase [Paenibacillus sp. RC67]